MEEILPKVVSLSGKLRLIEMVGHREFLGYRLVSEESARELEARIMEDLASSTTEQLVAEWDLFLLLQRPLGWLEGDEQTKLTDRLREHLDTDEFVLAILRSAVSYTFTNGDREKELPRDLFNVACGEELVGAVDRLAHSQLYASMTEDDQDTINLAQITRQGETRPPSQCCARVPDNGSTPADLSLN